MGARTKEAPAAFSILLINTRRVGGVWFIRLLFWQLKVTKKPRRYPAGPSSVSHWPVSHWSVAYRYVLVPVMFSLERSAFRNTEIIGLVCSQFIQLYTNFR